MLSARTSADELWLRTELPRPAARLRLICVPHAGGTSLLFRGWADAIGPDIEVQLAVLPGRESRMREPMPDRIQDLVAPLADAIAARSDRPTAIFGHSMGALLAYEVAQHLRDDAARPLHLFLSAARPPHRWHEGRRIELLSDAQFKDALRSMGTPSALVDDADMMQVLGPRIRADFAALGRYVHREDRAPLPTPITALMALDDTMLPWTVIPEWDRYTTGAFRAERFRGDHFYLTAARRTVLDLITADLQRSLGAGTPR